MSLQLAAQHIASHGRGDDKVLVHMTQKEVKSLSDLAMAHGGQLTINPKTGLPEAGFLSTILPIAAGLALGPAGFGLTSAMGAGLMVGAGSMILNPKAGLMGGLMAGLGAYGGANLGESLAMEGVKAATPTAAQVTPEALNPFTTDPTAYNSFNPTSTNYGAFGEAPTGSQVVSNNAAYNSFNPTSTNYGAFGEPPIGAPSAGGGSSFPTDAAGSFKSSTITNPLTSPNASPEALKNMTASERFSAIGKGITSGDLGEVAKNNIGSIASIAAPLLAKQPEDNLAPVGDKDMGQQYSYSSGIAKPIPTADVPTYEDMLTKQGNFGKQQNYYPNQAYTPISDTAAKELYHYRVKDGGVVGYADGGPVERMSNQAALGANTMYPMANMTTSAFATPYQTPQSTNMMASMAPSGGGTVDAMSGEPNMQGTRLATGGLSDARYNLGGYSDGGRLLRGPGDGVSDSIPAVIGKKQPARLADGEFVVPARIVSELGNGSTEAGARKLYAMMDRIQAARKQTVGKGKVAHNSRAGKYLPA